MNKNEEKSERMISLHLVPCVLFLAKCPSRSKSERKWAGKKIPPATGARGTAKSIKKKKSCLSSVNMARKNPFVSRTHSTYFVFPAPSRRRCFFFCKQSALIMCRYFDVVRRKNSPFSVFNSPSPITFCLSYSVDTRCVLATRSASGHCSGAEVSKR